MICANMKNPTIHPFQVHCQRKVSTAGGLQHATGTSTDHKRHDYAELMLRKAKIVVMMITIVHATQRFTQ